MARLVDKDAVETWVTHLHADIIEEGPVRAYSLSHAIEEHGLEQLCLVGNVGEKKPEDIAYTLWSTAENDADSRVRGMPQRYVIRAFRNDPEEHEGQIAFMITSQGVIDEVLRGASTERPTEAGHLSQLMRHTEAQAKLLVGYSEAVAGRFAKDNEGLRKVIELHETKRLQYVTAMEELLDRRQERDLRLEEVRRGREREDKIYGVLIALAPALLTKVFAGDSGSPGLAGLLAAVGGAEGEEEEEPAQPATSIGSTEAKLSELLKTFDMKDLQGISKVLGKEKTDKFLELYAAFRQNEAH